VRGADVSLSSLPVVAGGSTKGLQDTTPSGVSYKAYHAASRTFLHLWDREGSLHVYIFSSAVLTV
jgi:hypothetical protein